ncbi:uncharacterized protein [Penaeus vannamei]|uniref:uncharacterized protein n=1 Tax=Penaeus vannamei TaxID=6689 RepID=UPI00387FABD9
MVYGFTVSKLLTYSPVAGPLVFGNHRMVRGEIKLNLTNEKNKLIGKPQPNLTNLKTRATEFSLNIQNTSELKISTLTELTKSSVAYGVGRNQMYAIKKLDVEVTYNKNGIIVVEGIYTTQMDSRKRVKQAGFRSGFSTTDHIHMPTLIREKIKNIGNRCTFIDYEKAFDSVQMPAVLEAIRIQGVEEVYCKILEDVSEDGTVTIKLYTETDKIPIKKVRQGDTV